MRVDGNSISTNGFVTISGMSFGWLAVSGGSHSFTHVNNVDFSAMVYGASDRESYGFALGMDMTGTGVCI